MQENAISMEHTTSKFKKGDIIDYEWGMTREQEGTF